MKEKVTKRQSSRALLVWMNKPNIVRKAQAKAVHVCVWAEMQLILSKW